MLTLRQGSSNLETRADALAVPQEEEVVVKVSIDVENSVADNPGEGQCQGRVR